MFTKEVFKVWCFLRTLLKLWLINLGSKLHEHSSQCSSLMFSVGKLSELHANSGPAALQSGLQDHTKPHHNNTTLKLPKAAANQCRFVQQGHQSGLHLHVNHHRNPLFLKAAVLK